MAKELAEVQVFADILRAAMGDHKLEAFAEHLRVSKRAICYLLAGETLPCGSTLALIEVKVSRAVGLTVVELRQLVDQERGSRHGGARSAATRRAPARKREPATGVCP